MTVLLGCLMAHVMLSTLLPSPWWVPDLTLVGLMLALFTSPKPWLLYASVAGLATMVWAVRFPIPMTMSYLVVGASVPLIARQWDTTDVRVQCVVVSGTSLLMTAGVLWLENLTSLLLVVLVLIHVMMTGLSVLMVRRFFAWHALRSPHA